VPGAGLAVVVYYAAGTAVLLWYILSGRNVARFRWTHLRWQLFRDILGVGAVAAVTSLQTNFTIALATALVASAAGTDAIAGYGTGVRLEYLLIPLIFGLGLRLWRWGTNIGAGQKQRALRIALVGGVIAFAISEIIGLIAAFWPHAWLALFSLWKRTDAEDQTRREWHEENHSHGNHHRRHQHIARASNHACECVHQPE
jgi:Na+-driven multidrug efflux pump